MGELANGGAEEVTLVGIVDNHLKTPPAKDFSDENSDDRGGDTKKTVNTMIFPPNPELPKPEAPPGVLIDAENDIALSVNSSNTSPALPLKPSDQPGFVKFFREKSNKWSTAITKRLSSEEEEAVDVTEINLSGLKVVVKSKKNDDFKGRITFFSRSNCRDSTAVRSFLREMNLSYVEINLDVFPMREKELVERTGSAVVPQIFFNEKNFGGLVALNSMRNSGMLEAKMKELLGRKWAEDAPAPPVYGFDDPEEERMDEMVPVVRVLRQKLPIQDRLVKMKLVRNCFSASEMVEVLIDHFDCGRKKAVEMGKQLTRRHFIHSVSIGESEFEDGKHYYRFLEHEPFIPKCFNFRGSTNDLQPKAAAAISFRLMKIMSALLESYASEDWYHLDYSSVSNSEEFRRYVNLTQDLQRVDMWTLSENERLAFFLNLYNAMVIHAVISVGHPGAAVIDRRSFESDFLYVIGGFSYSLTAIKNGFLRNNRRAPYALAKPFAANDKRLELAIPYVNPLIHFGLCNATRSSPPVRFFTPEGIDSQLRSAARAFLQNNGIEVDLANRTVSLARLFKWFSVDFGQEKDILKWIIDYLDATKAGLLTHLLSDNGPVHIVYQDYDWGINS